MGNKEVLICKEQIVFICWGVGGSLSVTHWSLCSYVVASRFYWNLTAAETLEVYFKHTQSGWFKNRFEVWNDRWNISQFQNIQCFKILCIYIFYSICCTFPDHNMQESSYLRAKEKWAEALGEKFLGLSWGLDPKRRDNISCKHITTQYSMVHSEVY